MRKILVLGGTGYLGSIIVDWLIAHNDKVFCTRRKTSSLDRIKNHLSEITFIDSTLEDVKEIFEHNKIDWVISAICTYRVGEHLYEDMIESNMEYPLAVLNLCAMYGVKNFLTIGTGLPDEFNMYSFTKKSFSNFGKLYSEEYGMNFIDAELEMFFDSEVPEDRFMARCIKKMLKNEDVDLTIGTQHRDIVHTEDAVNAIGFILDQKVEGYKVIPVGTGEGPTIREIIQYIHQKTGSNSALNWGAVPMRKNEPDSIADISWLKSHGFVIKYSWKDAINKVINEKKERLDY